MDLVFKLNNGSIYKCDSGNLVGVFNNYSVEAVEVVCGSNTCVIPLKGYRFIHYSHDGRNFIGKQRTVRNTNVRHIYEVGGKGLIPVVL
jgi:hypothetical protein